MLAGVASLLAPDAPFVQAQLSPDERQALLKPNLLVMLGAEPASHLGRVVTALEALIADTCGTAPTSREQPSPLPYFSGSDLVVAADSRSAEPLIRRRVDNLLAGWLVDRLAQLDGGLARGSHLLVVARTSCHGPT